MHFLFGPKLFVRPELDAEKMSQKFSVSFEWEKFVVRRRRRRRRRCHRRRRRLPKLKSANAQFQKMPFF